MGRRLAAILAADIVGYSQAMAANETGTLKRLKAHRAEVFDPNVSAHNGRIIKLMGDGTLVEFASVVEAVECAIAIQSAMADGASAGASAGSDSLRLRIGINLGDVMIDGDDIYGDGVNVAARLEAVSQPGGICISDMVYQNINSKLDAEFEDMGEQALKNIAKPVRAWQWPASVDAVAPPEGAAAPSLPDKPSIAVLPFSNMSGDPGQEHFSDGITEDIITELSRFRTLFVIARNSSFAFKGTNADIKDVGEKLGVQYVVDGSVRQAGSRVRISAQLIEAASGNHIWAERYDRELEDIFALQDEVTQNIVAALPGRVQEDVAERASHKPASNKKAHEFMLQGKALRDRLNAEDTARARELCKKAIALDPRYARAHMYLADTYVVDRWLGLASDEAGALSLELARKAVSLDSNDVYLQDQLAFGYLSAGQWEDAEVQFEKTLSQIVNEAESMAWCGYGFMLLGRHEKAREVTLEAMRLDPMHPPTLDWILGQVHYFAGRYEDVVRVLVGEALLNSLAHALLAGAYAHLGRTEEARAALASFISVRRGEFKSRDIAVKGDTVEALTGSYRKMWRNEADWEHLADGLRKAGLGDAAEAVAPPLLSDRPSIAVLPFDNMSGDLEQEYFSDGISEDIITELSRFRELFVIARNSSFSYKGKARKVQEIGRDLGVAYILEGSVRKAGSRVRITAQLIEAASGKHIWAERYDRQLEDIFDLQDEITKTIVTLLPVRLQGALVETARRKPSGNLTAYDCYLHGRWLFDQSSGQDPKALELLGQALEHDSECAQAHAYIALAHAYSLFTVNPIGVDPTAAALEGVERALTCGEGDHFVHATAGWVYILSGRHDLADTHSRKAVALNPNDIFAMLSRGYVVTYLGDPSAGVEQLRDALRYDPHTPAYFHELSAEASHMQRDYEKAVEIYSRWERPPLHMYVPLAVNLAQLGRMDEARSAVETFKSLCSGDVDLDFYAATHARMCKRPEDAEHWLDGYRKAGLVE